MHDKYEVIPLSNQFCKTNLKRARTVHLRTQGNRSMSYMNFETPSAAMLLEVLQFLKQSKHRFYPKYRTLETTSVMITWLRIEHSQNCMTKVNALANRSRKMTLSTKRLKTRYLSSNELSIRRMKRLVHTLMRRMSRLISLLKS